MSPDRTNRILAIDLGSNTCRAIEYDCATGTFGRECERIVKTADRMHRTGRIGDAAVERIIAALKAADELFDFKRLPVRAVTTAAMRMASNRDEALGAIASATGVRFELIDADREAYYAMLAVRRRMALLGLGSDSLVMIDIGGGSTEVIFHQNGMQVSRSFPVGIVTIAQQCENAAEVQAMLPEVMRPVETFICDYYAAHGRVETFVTTAGTPTTIAAFLQGMTYSDYDPARINGYRLTLPACERALHALQQLDESERSRYVGVGRETLIVAGVVIVEAFYAALGFVEAVVIDDGVREGVAIDYCLQRGPD